VFLLWHLRVSYDVLASDNSYQKNFVVIVRWPCMSYDVLVSDNSYQKNFVVILRSPCMSYDARALDNSYQKNCVKSYGRLACRMMFLHRIILIKRILS